MKRYSKQREVIKQVLKNRCDHPTADRLYLDLKKELPEIGIATVYRNLAELGEAGEISKIKMQKGEPDRFDGNITPHIHLECDICDEIYDIFPDSTLYGNLTNDIQKLAELIGATSSNSAITIHGICEKCKNKEEKK